MSVPRAKIALARSCGLSVLAFQGEHRFSRRRAVSCYSLRIPSTFQPLVVEFFVCEVSVS